MGKQPHNSILGIAYIAVESKGEAVESTCLIADFRRLWVNFRSFHIHQSASQLAQWCDGILSKRAVYFLTIHQQDRGGYGCDYEDWWWDCVRVGQRNLPFLVVQYVNLCGFASVLVEQYILCSCSGNLLSCRD